MHDEETAWYNLENYQEDLGRGLQANVVNTHIKVGSAEYLGVQEEQVKGARVHLEIDGTYKGYFSIKNKYRPAFKMIVDQLRQDYNLHLLSGDNDSEKETLISYFNQEQNLHFNQQPQDKLNYIVELRNQGAVVMMVGDGLNDAGALLESHVGIAVSEGVYNFSPACDAIVKASKLRALPAILKLGKYSLRVLRWSYSFSIIYNLVGLYFAASGLLTPLIAAILMPLSSISVVALTTISMAAFEQRNLKN